jgi:hypothetical protein
LRNVGSQSDQQPLLFLLGESHLASLSARRVTPPASV